MENKNSSQSFEQGSNPPTLFDRITNSIMLKMVVIFFLVIIMLIPMSLIDDLVSERKNREQVVSSEIAAKWGKSQVVSTPILAVPYTYTRESTKKDVNGKEYMVISQDEDWIFLLPEKSDVKVNVTPEYLKRGIYQSVVYNSSIEINGAFGKFDIENLGIATESIKWSQAKLVLGVQDVKGLSTTPIASFAGLNHEMKMNSKLFDLFPNNMISDLKLNKEDEASAPFKIKYELKGSKSFNFLPLANQVKLEMNGGWGNPSFNGGYLPDDRTVDDSSFSATWNIPSFGRKLPQQWVGSNQVYNFMDVSLVDEHIDYQTEMHSGTNTNLISSDQDMVQINFLPEVNNYQKTTRVAKYGVLIIVLTFASLFFTEIIKKRRIHLIQYLLIGAAMVLFYSLLLAISEHLGFNIAYFLAAVATILLISTFIKMIIKDRKTALLFACILGLFYSFIFVLMQLRDYSLIVGTIGIFIILAILMRFSTKIDWYQFDRK